MNASVIARGEPITETVRGQFALSLYVADCVTAIVSAPEYVTVELVLPHM